MLATLITLMLAGFVGLIALAIVLAIIGTALSITFALTILALKLAPILLVGWIVLRLVARNRQNRAISAADRRWLDS